MLSGSASKGDDDDAKGDKGTFGETITNLTPGIKNIQGAYERAGAKHDHTPGYSGTLGSQEQHHRNKAAKGDAGGREGPSKIGDSSSKGLLAKQEEAKVGSDSTEPSAIGQFAKDLLTKR